MPFSPIHDAWFLAGPTASGKSTIALELARSLDAEIVSMDSMAVYRGMDIGTAKPTTDQQAEIPHHLIDVVAAHVDFSISEYLTSVHEVVRQIRSRDHAILFVGGTPLYLKALLSGFDDGPAADWELRTELEEQADREGAERLHRQLVEIDPEAARRVHPHDRRRTIRAIEVFKKTGKTISSVQRHFDESGQAVGCRVVALDWPRGVLHQRINERVDRMFEAGLVNEVRTLLAQYNGFGRTATQAVGYQEAIAEINGEMSREDAVRRTKTRSRQLARRQLVWLRGLAECNWLGMSDPVDASAVADWIVRLCAPASDSR